MISFGLSKNYRDQFREQILSIVVNSNGGITFSEAWNIPIATRRFVVKWLSNRIEKQNEAVDKQKGNMTMKDMIGKKPMVPDYIAKAPIKK